MEKKHQGSHGRMQRLLLRQEDQQLPAHWSEQSQQCLSQPPDPSRMGMSLVWIHTPLHTHEGRLSCAAVVCRQAELCITQQLTSY